MAQCGVMWMNVQLSGKPAHVLDTRKGISAIEAAYAIFNHLREEEQKLNDKKHAAYANVSRPINFNLGKIEGGNWASSVASHCNMTVRVGCYPDDSLPDYRKLFEAKVAEKATELGVHAKVSWNGKDLVVSSFPFCFSYSLSEWQGSKRRDLWPIQRMLSLRHSLHPLLL